MHNSKKLSLIIYIHLQLEDILDKLQLNPNLGNVHNEGVGRVERVGLVHPSSLGTGSPL